MLDAVEKSRLVVLVFSGNANQSQWVQDEIAKALEKNITIIPFRIENISPTGRLEPVLNRFHCLEAYNSQFQNYIPELIRAVQKHLGIETTKKIKTGGTKDFSFNPFTEVRAISEAARFIGRETETRRLLTLLQGGSVTLRGAPKIGKSSLLRHLARAWNGQVLGPLDCQALENREDFFDTIAKALMLDKSNWRTIRNKLDESRVLFLLDELDFGSQRGITNDDLALFRSLCDSNRDFKMVAVSRSPLKEVFPDTGRGSPGFNLMMPLPLGLLTEAEARQLLSHPWAADAPLFDVKTCDQLLELTGCHPYKLQRAAFHFFEFLADREYDWEARYVIDLEYMK